MGDNKSNKDRFWNLALPIGANGNRDFAVASIVLKEFKYVNQLQAIQDLLDRHQELATARGAEIDELIARDEFPSYIHADMHNDTVTDRVIQSSYEDSVHSMAAVALIAPFIESMFSHTFRNIGELLSSEKAVPIEHERWQRASKDTWDCRYVWTKGGRQKNIVNGIIQMAEATKMTEYLPDDLQPTLEAIFAYRNKMFHCGLEWPLEERKKFEKQIADREWKKDWFLISYTNHQPWCYYMSPSFVEHSISTCENIVRGIGRFGNAIYAKRFRTEEETNA